MKTYDCDLYMDLMPLVRDDAASQTTRQVLQEHLQSCESCAELFASMPETPAPDQEEPARVLNRIRRRLRLGAWTVLVLSALVGGFLSMTDGMGYNLILFPLVGVVACLGLGWGAWRAGTGIAVLSFAWTALKMAFEPGAAAWDYLAALGFSLCYAAAFEVGVGVAWLLGYAFRKPKEEHMKRSWKQIVSGLLAAVTLAGALYVCDLFLGNPISCAAARNHAQNYLLEQYPDEVLVAGEPTYDWYMTQGYEVLVSSPGTKDGEFMLYYDRLGRLEEDTHDARVDGGLNTFDRISTACQMEILDVQGAIEEATGMSVTFWLASDWPSIYDDVGYPFEPEDRIILAQLEPDGKYDTRELLERYGCLEIWGLTEQVSEAEISRILLAVQSQLEAYGIPMANVDVRLFDEADNRMEVATFPVEAIGTPDMAQRVHEARIAWDEFQVVYEAYIAELNRNQG